MLPTNPLLNATAPAGPHLPVATLRQYAAGTLTGAARHRVEAHTLACPRCADILEGLLQTPPATTDQALTQLQQRLRLRLQQADHARPALPRLRQRWLMPQLAAAATLLFGLLAGGWYTWQQRHATPAVPEVAVTRPPAPPRVPAASAPLATAPPVVRRAAPLPVPSRPAAPTRSGHPAASQPLAYEQEAEAPAGLPAATPAVAPAATPLPRFAPDSTTFKAARGRDDASVASGAAADTAANTSRLASMAPARRSAAAAPGGRTQMSVMPAAPAVPPTPTVGYPAWREKIRREATEFKPEEERPLSGTVQLRLLIGADGKIQAIRVLHGLRPDYDEEAQRLVCDGPAWIPGIGGGKRAAQAIDVSVPFQ